MTTKDKPTARGEKDSTRGDAVPRASLFGSFGARLYFLLLVIIIPALIVTLHEDFSEQRGEKDRLREGAQALSSLAAADQENLISNARQLLSMLSKFPFQVLSSNHSLCENQLQELRKLLPDYANFGLIDTKGEIVCSALPLTNSIYIGDRAWFRRAVETKEFSVSDFQLGRITQAPVLTFAYPVLDEQSRVSRILFASLDLSRLSQSIDRIHLPDRGRISVLDRNGLILARIPYGAREIGKPLLDQTSMRAVSAQRGGAFEIVGQDHVSRFFAVKPVPVHENPVMFVVVEVPLTVLFARADELLFGRIILLAVVACAIFILVSHYAKRFLVTPVKSLAIAAERLAGGDLGARAGKVGGARELSQLGSVLDAMAERVEARTAELIHTNDALRAEIVQRKRAEEEVKQQKEEREKLEEQILRSQRMEGIGALAGGIAHDLNNALVPVVIGSHMLQQGGDNCPDRQQVLELIEGSGRRCTALVKQMLTFARGSREESSSVPIRHLIQEMAGIARDTFPKNIEVLRTFPKDLSSVQGNATELHQILLNLCVNARDAMPAGGQLVISAENVVLSEQHLSDALPGSYVALTVSDTGSGIAPEVRARLFEPFFTTKGPHRGTGLGLSTVANIVKRHKGFIEVRSEVGKGSEFKVFIPAAGDASATPADVAASSLPFGHGELILLVDDEKSILEIGRSALENYGYAVVTASNGLEAVASFELHKREISIIVMDTDMPYLDGAGALQAIRKTGKHVPVILASASASDTALLSRVDLARVERLIKPYGIPDLLHKVAGVLGSNGQNKPSVPVSIESH